EAMVRSLRGNGRSYRIVLPWVFLAVERRPITSGPDCGLCSPALTSVSMGRFCGLFRVEFLRTTADADASCRTVLGATVEPPRGGVVGTMGSAIAIGSLLLKILGW